MVQKARRRPPITIEGKLENWHELHKLALRTHLGSGKFKIGDKEIDFDFSLNIDNKAIFVEFPDSIKVTYTMEDLINDAMNRYTAYLTTK